MARGKEEFEARKERLNSFGKDLAKRAKSKCELCAESKSLAVYEVAPIPEEAEFDRCLMICDDCKNQVENLDKLEVNYWHCLNETAWSEVPAVQVVVWRLLEALKTESWAQDLQEQIYLDEETLDWAENDGTNKKSIHFDSNNAPLFEGDTVHVIKDLEVRGAGFVAKRGTVVKGIHLCTNPEHIEGRVNKTKIVLKTCFLKKVN